MLLEAAGDEAERVGLGFTIEVAQRLRAIDGISGLHSWASVATTWSARSWRTPVSSPARRRLTS